MKAKNAVLTMMFGAVAVMMPAYAQDENGRQEVSVQSMGTFLKTTTDKGLEQGAKNTGGVLASYRLFFDRHSGIEANYSFSSTDQIYGPSGSLAKIDTRTHEASAAYVYRIQYKRFTPFILAGAGALVFDPKDAAGAKTQTRAAFLYGAGADINLSRHLFMRAEYRGFVYQSPNYEIAGLNGLERTTHSAQPSLGVGYRF